jgi:two-component system KDP operon response regulator KdpE
MNRPTILLVEDEAALRRFLVPTLTAHGFQVLEAATAQAGIRMARTHNPDLILLDLGLPDLDGSFVLEEVRRWSRKPVIILSARSQERQKVRALDLGADDYLTKPFGADELLARIRVGLRHLAGRGEEGPFFRSGALCVDLERREVSLAGEPVKLSHLEYRLLESLVHRAGKVATHAQLLEEVWGPGGSGQVHYLRIYMAQLRRKLEPDPGRPKHFLTEPNVGYRLKASGENDRP